VDRKVNAVAGRKMPLPELKIPSATDFAANVVKSGTH